MTYIVGRKYKFKNPTHGSGFTGVYCEALPMGEPGFKGKDHTGRNSHLPLHYLNKGWELVK